jgi:hypothetical protein
MSLVARAVYVPNVAEVFDIPLRRERVVNPILGKLDMAALRAIVEGRALPEEFDQMLSCAASMATSFARHLQVYAGLAPWLLAAEGSWKPNSRLNQYRGVEPLLSYLEQRYGIIASSGVAHSSVVNEEHGLRHVALVPLTSWSVSNAIHAIHRDASASLLLSCKSFRRTDVEQAYLDAFVDLAPHSLAVIWPYFAQQRVRQGEVVLQATGESDERIAEVTAYGPRTLLRRAASNVAPPRESDCAD